jgi:uncharacterized protein with FMN-binding domain
MRRAISLAAVTAGGLALLATFHTSRTDLGLNATGPGDASTAPPNVPTDATSETGSTATPAPISPGSTAAASTTSVAGGAASAGTTARTISAPKTSSTAAPKTSTSAGSSTGRAIDGPDITTRYGDVQVRITLQGSRLVDVRALRLPQDRARSARISQTAGPQLRQEALQAQSAHINVVSGASYTSEGYAESLQGALDSAGK